MTTIQDALDMLPTNLDTLANFLEIKGIKGKRTHSRQCPISIFLGKQLGYSSVTTGSFHIGFNSEFISTPFHIRRFIDRFDHGLYPQLIER